MNATPSAMMRAAGVGVQAAAWWIQLLLTALAIATASPPMILPLVASALITAHFRATPQQNTTHQTSFPQTSRSTDTENRIIALLERQNALLSSLPSSIGSEVASAVATQLANIELPSSNVASVPVPGTLGQEKSPSKIVLDARKWLDDHPEHAGKTVRAIADLSGFSKSTIDRARKLAA